MQTWFAVQHLGLFAGLDSLTRLAWSDMRGSVARVVLVLGGYASFLLVPASPPARPRPANLGITGWMLLFAALGYGMTRLEVSDE